MVTLQQVNLDLPVNQAYLVIEAVVPSVASLYVGPWTDQHGRKWPMESHHIFTIGQTSTMLVGSGARLTESYVGYDTKLVNFSPNFNSKLSSTSFRSSP
jgi:hypothetical protein